MSTYKKRYLTFEEQLELIKSRGLEVTDDDMALDYLRRIGYYHLSAYWYSFRQISPLNSHEAEVIPSRSDEFISGCSFQHVVELYVFDKRLRLLLLDAIERIEVAIRVDVAYLLGSKDPFAHSNPDLLHGKFTKKINPRTEKTDYETWIAKHEKKEISAKDDFARHFREKYGFPLPIWVAVELWDFGMLSMFYQGMAIADKEVIATRYGIPNWQIMESWLRSLNFIRNVTAHHGRLWNRNLIDQPKLPRIGEIPSFDPVVKVPLIESRLYVDLCILIYF
ncbi:MAG: Abi family protein, partial [Candidatus Nanopelagicaceae bacterium]|nr:Abi family protein [Candidatus Nanopelagicaceae bacterium]